MKGYEELPLKIKEIYKKIRYWMSWKKPLRVSRPGCKAACIPEEERSHHPDTLLYDL